MKTTEKQNVETLVEVLKGAMEHTKAPDFLKDSVANRIVTLKGIIEAELQEVMKPAYIQSLIRKTLEKLIEQLILSELGIDVTWRQARFTPNSDATVSKTIRNFAAEETAKILNEHKLGVNMQKILEAGIEKEMKDKLNRYDSSLGQFIDKIMSNAYKEVGVEVDRKSGY